MPKNEGPDADPDVEQVRKKVLIAEIERKGRIQAILDYVGLAARILLGVACLTVSVLGFFYPTLLPVNSISQGMSLAIGLSSLGITGVVMSWVGKTEKALK